MKSKPSKNYYQRMFIVRNESAQSRKYQLYQSAPQTSISFMINGQSLTKTKINTQTNLTPKEIKVKQALKSIKYKLQSLKFEQSEIKKQVMQQSETFKSNLKQIKSKEVQNINAIQQYFNEQNKYPLIYLYFQGSSNKTFRNFNNKQKLQTYQVQFLQ
ncbi:unnamed protein product (macronuclear) [Paramecium tetraurelia]|uniref:Uncharacterized protein n=1 Tax=Paramecium tetraurelia TaxID=5888 RepID=A0D2I8_PARTE|nr:uncharacterized protein GSPATT00012763001 [Paramecium tetraurelia]CAK77255.1 unnamed protein product [Paramecium tetraurelia]|eukprot:XP_001444652.1 hypothetical protein (macronuclear) [Paramecium tetraurelia strain d4-2]